MWMFGLSCCVIALTRRLYFFHLCLCIRFPVEKHSYLSLLALLCHVSTFLVM